MKQQDLILNTTRFSVRYVDAGIVRQKTFFIRERARDFARGKVMFGRAAKVERVVK